MNVINSISKLVFHKYKKRVDKSWFSFLMFTLDDEKTLGVHILYEMYFIYKQHSNVTNFEAFHKFWNCKECDSGPLSSTLVVVFFEKME